MGSTPGMRPLSSALMTMMAGGMGGGGGGDLSDYADFLDEFTYDQMSAENLLKAADDLTNNTYWTHQEVNVVNQGNGETLITRTTSNNWKGCSEILVNWLPPWADYISLFVDIKSSTIARCDLRWFVDIQTVAESGEVISGPGTLTWYGGTAKIENLSSTVWTKVRLTVSVKDWYDNVFCDFMPGGWDGSATDAVIIRNQQVVLGNEVKPRPVGQETAYPMMAYRPHWRKTLDGNARCSVVDGTVNTTIATNGGFETAGGGGADIWADWDESASDGALANETTEVHSGSDAAKITAGASANTYIVQTKTVTPLASYELRYWTRGDGTHDGRFQLYDLTNTTDIVAKGDTGVTGTSYAEVVVRFTAPAGCTQVSYYFHCADTDGGIFYLDDLSLRENQTSGLVWCGEATDMAIAPATGSAFTCPANFEFSTSFTFETTQTVRYYMRYTDTSNYGFHLYISGTGNVNVYENGGGGAVKLDEALAALTDGVFYRIRCVVSGTGASVYLDDALLYTVTLSEYLTNTGGYMTHTLASNDLKVVAESNPKQPGLIIAGGKAANEQGDPGIWWTTPAGASFEASAADAALITAKTWVASKTAYLGFDDDVAGGLSNPRLRHTVNTLNLRTAVENSETPQAWAAGSEISFMQYVRSSNRGYNCLLLDSGKQWDLFNANPDTVKVTCYPVISNHSAALSLPRVALLDLSSQWDRDFAEVTDTKTNPASTTTFDCDADFYLRTTFTYEAGTLYRCHFRYADSNNWLAVYALTTGTFALAKRTDGADSNLNTEGLFFSDGVEYQIDVVGHGPSIAVYVDNVLWTTQTETDNQSNTGGYVLQTLATNDIVITTHPNPALGMATDRVVCPQQGDTGDCESDCVIIQRGVLTGSASVSGNRMRFRIQDANNHMMIQTTDAGFVRLYKKEAGGYTQLIGVAASISDGEDLMCVCNGANAEIFVNGTSIGSSSGAVFEGETGWELESYEPGGGMDSVELWPNPTMPFKL